MLLLLVALACSKSWDEIPPFSLLICSSDCTSSDEMQEGISQLEEICGKVKEGDQLYAQCQLMSKFKSYHCIHDPSKVNDEFSKISKDSKYLYAHIGFRANNNISIDLNKLSTAMDVSMLLNVGEFTPGEESTMEKFHGIGIHAITKAFSTITGKSMIKKSKSLTKKSKSYLNSEIDAYPKGSVIFNGNIGHKVHTLSLYVLHFITISESDLNVENFYFFHGIFNPDSKAIKSKQFYIHDSEQYFLDLSLKAFNIKLEDLIQCEQYGIILFSDENEQEVQISFEKDHWALKKKDGENWVPYWYNGEDASSVYYSFLSSFGIISVAQHFDLYFSSTEFPKGKNINISVSSFSFESYPMNGMGSKSLEEKQKNKVSLTMSGKWKEIAKEQLPKVYVNYDKSEVQLDISDEMKEAGIIQESELYKYSPEDDDGPNVGMIVGIVVACVVVVAAIIVVVVIVLKKKQKVANQNS